jgi:hypothetical protein
MQFAGNRNSYSYSDIPRSSLCFFSATCIIPVLNKVDGSSLFNIELLTLPVRIFRTLPEPESYSFHRPLHSIFSSNLGVLH